MPEWLDYRKALRSLNPARVLINTTCNKFDLPSSVKDNSLSIYQHLIAKNLTIGRKREGLVGACVYTSCQGVDYPIDLGDLCKRLGVSKKSLIRQQKFIKQHVETNESLIDPRSFVSKYCYELGLNESDKTKAYNELKKVKKQLINHQPRIKAAISLYKAHKDKYSIRQVIRTTGLSRSALYNAYKKVK